MLPIKRISAALITVIAVAFISSCSEHKAPNIAVENIDKPQPQTLLLNVHKSPSCGCCKLWINHLQKQGIQAIAHDSQDMSMIKRSHNIAPRYRSCHTAVSEAGFIFEGHVPAKYIQQFVSESHSDDVIGLSVPAMPLGSPGMEVDDKFHPYKVLLLKKDGSYEVYASIKSYQEQF